MEPQTIGIIGFGRFGQFWAKTFAQTHRVLVTDQRDLSDLAHMLNVHFKPDLADLCAEASAIFLCVPISHLKQVTKALKTHLKPETVVFDTCSVKVYPARILQNNLGDLKNISLIATHPMFGPDSGANGLYGLRMVMWPLSELHTMYDIWVAYFKALGLTIVEISPETHDRLAANSQGITHYIGRVLGALDLTPTEIDTTGFALLLSVIQQTCNDTWQLFCDLQTYNPYTKPMRLHLEAALRQVYSSLLPESVSPGETIIGIQGGHGSFSETACEAYCLTHAIKTPIIKPLYTAMEVLAGLHKGELDYGVLAVQSTCGGAVIETLGALSEYTCDILDYIQIIPRHAILHRPEIPFAQIKKLISHPHALAQCEKTLSTKYPHLKIVRGKEVMLDQISCVEGLLNGQLPPSTAVLAPERCAVLYNLALQETNLQDLGDDNYTTFIWVRRRRYGAESE